MKRGCTLIVVLMLLAGCASAGNLQSGKTTQPESARAKDAGQDFSHSQDFQEQLKRTHEYRGYP
jgi:hypothetical protein